VTGVQTCALPIFFLIDADGNVRNIYSSDTLDPRLVLADVKTLLGEKVRSQSTASGPLR